MLTHYADNNIAGVVLAAGLSRRMGQFKPLLPYAQSSIIENTVANLKQAGAGKIIVVTGYRSTEIVQRFLNWDNVLLVKNYNYQHGEMLESVQLGLKQVSDCDATYVVPGDMPAIAVETFIKVRQCMDKTKAKIVFPTINGKRKHPPLINSSCFPAICSFKGEGGLRVALEQFLEQTVCVPVEDIGCTIDADTWEDYMRLQAYHRYRSIIT